MNQRLPPGVTQIQVKNAGICPMKCHPDPGFRMNQTLAHQEPGGVVRLLMSRCFHCLAYWETDTCGKITKLMRPVSIELCPDCRHPVPGEVADKYTCKNPRHALV